ncbi:uncharacterized [Tachysurus ichikawai]
MMSPGPATHEITALELHKPRLPLSPNYTTPESRGSETEQQTPSTGSEINAALGEKSQLGAHSFSRQLHL